MLRACVIELERLLATYKYIIVRGHEGAVPHILNKGLVVVMEVADCACYFCRDPDKDGDNPCKKCFSLPKPKRYTPPLGYRKYELRECFPCFQVSYLFDKLPFVRWLIRYNARWLVSDIIAGLTVGLMVVPQGLAYASIANLPPRVSGFCS